VVVGGDFNCVIDPELDRSRLTHGNNDARALQQWIEDWRLVDANAEQQLEVRSDADKLQYYADHHTYRYRIGDDSLASSRLDRWYVSSQWTHCISLLEVTPPAAASDHDAVWLVLKEAGNHGTARTKRGRKAIKYPLTPAAKERVQAVANAAISDLVDTVQSATAADSAGLWDAIKEQIRTSTLHELHEQRQRVTMAYRQRRRRLRKALREAQRVIGIGLTEIRATVDGITRAMGTLSINHHAR
jgi:hypothetical protein